MTSEATTDANGRASFQTTIPAGRRPGPGHRHGPRAHERLGNTRTGRSSRSASSPGTRTERVDSADGSQLPSGAMPIWRCPHCGTPQAETARCWVCRRSSTACATCRHFRRSVAANLGYCGLDRAGRRCRRRDPGLLGSAAGDPAPSRARRPRAPPPPMRAPPRSPIARPTGVRRGRDAAGPGPGARPRPGGAGPSTTAAPGATAPRPPRADGARRQPAGTLGRSRRLSRAGRRGRPVAGVGGGVGAASVSGSAPRSVSAWVRRGRCRVSGRVGCRGRRRGSGSASAWASGSARGPSRRRSPRRPLGHDRARWMALR